MIAVLTGDIQNSSSFNSALWLEPLKKVLAGYGPTPKKWDIFRGDSFQLEVNVEHAILAALQIKAVLRAQHKNLDARIAIGIGDKTYDANRIQEANGSAFVQSGLCFDGMKKSKLAFSSANEALTENLNIMLDLASLTMNSWTTLTAKVLLVALNNPRLTQTEIAVIAQRKQSEVSKILKRAGLEPIRRVERYYLKTVTRMP